MAYAAVISLKHTLEYLMNFQISMSDLDSLRYTLRRLDSSCNRSINRSAINALDAQIREVIRKVEDALLSHRLLPEEIASFTNTVRKLKEEYSRELDNPLPPQEEDDDVLQEDEFDGKSSTTVGLRDQFEQIRNELLDSQSEPKVVALFGMAGIGKSHLAREIYRHPLIDERFDYKVWLSVGPQQQVKHLWAEIVATVEGVRRNAYMKTNIITLVGLLQKNMRGRGRCLIVLDDVWSAMLCDSLIRLLRIDGNGRRILLTTRLEEVAKYVGTSIHQIRFMDKEESWKLLWQNVFGEEYFPRELEEAGRKIAENCEGLPLLILAIAEILSGLEKTEEYWNKVAESKTTTFTDAYERISEVLFSSYEYLPQYLKACFLYMGVFPQKYQIPLPKLLHLWIVDDVLEPQQCLITRKRYAKSESTNKIDEPLMRNCKSLVSRIPEYVDLLEPNRSETSSLRVLEDDCLEPNCLETSSVRISEDVDLLEPNWLETSGLKITEDVDLLEPDWSETSSLRVSEDVDLLETNRLETSSLRISEDVDLLEPNRLETSIVENVDLVEPKPDQLETSSLRILEDVDLSEPDQLETPSLMISEDVDLPELNLFETSSSSIAEDVEFSVPNLLETLTVRILEDDTLSRAERFLPRVDSRALYDVFWKSRRNDFKICRYEAKKPLESLYLLEPGPSPIRFIEPWEKSKSRDSRLCLNRNLWSPREQPLPRAMDMSVPKDKTTPKGIAMDHLKKLVSHSLAIVCKRSSTNKIKSCKLHSAYWYLCVKEARKNKFFHVLTKLTDASVDYIESQRRLSVQNNLLFGIKEVYESMAATSMARSLLCTGPDQEYPVPICSNLMLIKVLDAVAIRLYNFPTEVVKLFELRYLALTHNGKPPSSISNLQQLEYLIIRRHRRIEFLRDSTPFPKDMRNRLWAMREKWSTNLLRDPTRSVKDIWEKICGVQEVWSSRLQANSTCLTEEIWMNIWELIWDMQQVRRTPLMRENILCRSQLVRDMKELWSNELLRDFNCFPEKIWVDIWRKMWNILQAWKSILHGDSISLLKEIWEEIWNMKIVKSTKLLSDSTFLPDEIWLMQELRYLRIKGRNLPDPREDTQLPNLLTLHVNARSCTYNVFKRIPSLKKLGIEIELQPEADETLSCFKYTWLLEGLKSLKCVVVNPWLRSQAVAPPHHLSKFPTSLKKLSLSGLGYSWEYMRVIGLLPELKVLKLRCSAFQGPEWETEDDEFLRLKYLLLEDIDLVRWSVASDYCFRSLRCLIIRHCYKLKKLPGVIAALNTIEVVDCSPSVVKQTHEDRKCCAGDVITSSWSLRR